MMSQKSLLTENFEPEIHSLAMCQVPYEISVIISFSDNLAKNPSQVELKIIETKYTAKGVFFTKYIWSRSGLDVVSATAL